MIMEFLVGVEYLNFRATCKECQLAAPVIRWRNEASLVRLKTYSLPSPWLMVFDTHQGIITFTDPMFGDKYFMKTPSEMIGDVRIHWSGYGWLLVFNLSHEPLSVMLFNPFTNDIRMLPPMGYIRSVCFSAPPTSPDCKFVGFIANDAFAAYVHFVNRKPEIWVVLHAIIDENVPRSISFPTLCDDRDVYALEAEGRLDVYRSMDDQDEAGRWFWEVVAEAPRGCSSEAQCFLMKCEENRLLLVRVDEYGESVEVYKLNQSTHEWEKIDGLGRRMIYICGATCICKEAKTPEMENKIYFPRLHSKNGKIVFYSFETRKFHTFNDRKFEEESFGGFLGTKYILNPHVWIEPSWSH
ncbi:F-box/kelch-repeat protein At1g57790-like [Bidens hawaiensis]|uniref:F-box/kelch-repeat protein At1g57790-like n=1 Tax=Bidens hawaiensis TaxID=980011 RepID=UPI00404939AD